VPVNETRTKRKKYPSGDAAWHRLSIPDGKFTAIISLGWWGDVGYIFYEQNNLADQLPVHHITIFTSKDILVDHTSNGKHG